MPPLARIQAHFDAGANHVCAQLFTPDAAAVPDGAWRELAAGLAGLNR